LLQIFSNIDAVCWLLLAASSSIAIRYTKTADPAVLKTPEGVTVSLIKGAIADQQVLSTSYLL